MDNKDLAKEFSKNPAKAAKEHPSLKAEADAFKAVEKKVNSWGLEANQKKYILDNVKAGMVKAIEAGKMLAREKQPELER